MNNDDIVNGGTAAVPTVVDLRGFDQRFAAIWRRARSIGRPEHYVTDLLHDQQALAGLELRHEYLWVVRRCGTHLLSPRTDPNWTRAIWKQADRADRWFHGQGDGVLIEMSLQQALEVVNRMIEVGRSLEPVVAHMAA